MGCGSSQSASTSSLGSANGKPKQENSSTSLRKQVLIAQSEPKPHDGQSLGGNDAGQRADSRSTCRDSGIDSAKTTDGRRALRQASLQSTDQPDQTGREGADSRQKTGELRSR